MSNVKTPCICQGGTVAGCAHLREAPCDCSGGPTPPCERELWEKYWSTDDAQRTTINDKLNRCTHCKTVVGYVNASCKA